MNKQFLKDLGMIYEQNVLNEMVPVEFGGTEPEKADLSGYASEPATIPGLGETAKRFYLPYYAALRDAGADVSEKIAKKIAVLALEKIKNEHAGVFPGNVKDFESQVLQGVVIEVLTALGVKKPSANYAGYVSRALMQAGEKTGIFKVTGARDNRMGGGSRGATKIDAASIDAALNSLGNAPTA